MRPQPKTLYHLRPKLDEILNDTAPVPYTLGTFIAFLAQNHCLEVLEFILEAKRYRKTYGWLEHQGPKCDEDAVHEERLRRVWDRIIDTYIESGAPREINVPNETREELLEYTKTHDSIPPPNLLDSAVQHMHELLRDSILIPFLRSCSGTSHVQPLSVPCLSDRERLRPSPRASDDSTTQRRSMFSSLMPSSPADTGSSTGSEPPTRCISRERASQEPLRSSSSDTGREITGGHDWDILPSSVGSDMWQINTAPERRTRLLESPKKRWRGLQVLTKHFRRSD
ncbi:RGS domain-containing protein [Aspergillus bertholletiae]|uniref:RGS domain-containing protein n=1 Tax=Aspergillus bertholletiae TaxID=1226010 RepID=A0A5N7BHN9_9EURO|nr:RGS domain-containing protein [Aspergillus bertholletiae]